MLINLRVELWSVIVPDSRGTDRTRKSRRERRGKRRREWTRRRRWRRRRMESLPLG